MNCPSSIPTASPVARRAPTSAAPPPLAPPLRWSRWRSSLPTMPPGSAAGWRAPSWTGSWGSGGRRWPACPRSTFPPTGAGATVERRLSDEIGVAARDYARTHQVSFLAVLQAALLTVLHRWTGQDDLPIGSVFSGRTRAETEPLVGYFVNTLVLRTRLDGDPTFAELVGRCH